MQAALPTLWMDGESVRWTRGGAKASRAACVEFRQEITMTYFYYERTRSPDGAWYTVGPFDTYQEAIDSRLQAYQQGYICTVPAEGGSDYGPAALPDAIIAVLAAILLFVLVSGWPG